MIVVGRVILVIGNADNLMLNFENWGKIPYLHPDRFILVMKKMIMHFLHLSHNAFLYAYCKQTFEVQTFYRVSQKKSLRFRCF